MLPFGNTVAVIYVKGSELLEALVDIFASFNIVAFDHVELAPSLDPSGRSTALACKLLREELLALRILT